MKESALCRKVDAEIKARRDIFAVNIHGHPCQRRGIPDRVGNVGPVGFYLELKATGKKRSEIQRAVARKIIRSGGEYLCTDRFEEVLEFFDRLRKLPLHQR